MTIKSVLFIFLSILALVSLSSAQLVPIFIPVDSSNPSAESNREKIPLDKLVDFSQKQDCVLSPYTKSSINQFSCAYRFGEWYLTVNSNGDILNARWMKFSQDSLLASIPIFLVIAFLIILSVILKSMGTGGL